MVIHYGILYYQNEKDGSSMKRENVLFVERLKNKQNIPSKNGRGQKKEQVIVLDLDLLNKFCCW